MLEPLEATSSAHNVVRRSLSTNSHNWSEVDQIDPFEPDAIYLDTSFLLVCSCGTQGSGLIWKFGQTALEGLFFSFWTVSLCFSTNVLETTVDSIRTILSICQGRQHWLFSQKQTSQKHRCSSMLASWPNMQCNTALRIPVLTSGLVRGNGHTHASGAYARIKGYLFPLCASVTAKVPMTP